MVDSNELIPTPSSTSFKILRLKLIRPPPIWIICNPIVILDLTVGISDDYGVQFNGGKVKLTLNVLDSSDKPIEGIKATHSDIFDSSISQFHPLKLSLQFSKSIQPQTIQFELSAQAMEDYDESNLSSDSLKMLNLIGEGDQIPYTHWNQERYVFLGLLSGGVELRMGNKKITGKKIGKKEDTSEKKVQTIIRRIHTPSKIFKLIERPGLNNSTGQRLWDCAIGLTLFLSTHPNSLPSSKSNRTIEVGAGIGLVGMICYNLGYQVICTDVKVTVETSLEENLKENKIQIKSTTLDWGIISQESKLELLGPMKEDSAITLVGSDILYNPESHSVLLSTLQSFLIGTKNNQAYIAYKPRTEGDGNFFELAKEGGLKVEKVWEWSEIQVWHFSEP